MKSAWKITSGGSFLCQLVCFYNTQQPFTKDVDPLSDGDSGHVAGCHPTSFSHGARVFGVFVRHGPGDGNEDGAREMCQPRTCHVQKMAYGTYIVPIFSSFLLHNDEPQTCRIDQCNAKIDWIKPRRKGFSFKILTLQQTWQFQTLFRVSAAWFCRKRIQKEMWRENWNRLSQRKQ